MKTAVVGDVSSLAISLPGSSLTKDVTINTYDVWNQLVKTIVGDKTITNTYNGDGLRVAKTVNGQMTNYLYEGDKVILEVDSTGTETGRNVYGTNLVSRTVDGQTVSYMYNGHGDVTAILDSTGSIVATYYYDAFGNIVEQTGNVNNSVTYAGYQYDKETGLYYLNARMYDPVTARFMQEDTYRGSTSDPLSLNLYTYCHNEPMMYTDPTGHFAQSDILKYGATGNDVKLIQAALNKAGCSLTVDGIFGDKTLNAVKTFQTNNKVKSTAGIVDANTWQWLGLQLSQSSSVGNTSKPVTTTTKPKAPDPAPVASTGKASDNTELRTLVDPFIKQWQSAKANGDKNAMIDAERGADAIRVSYYGYENLPSDVKYRDQNYNIYIDGKYGNVNKNDFWGDLTFDTVVTLGIGTVQKAGAKAVVERGIARGAGTIVAKAITREEAAIVAKNLEAAVSREATRKSVVDKLDRYLLNFDHPVGGSKAKWFKEALGFDKRNMSKLADQIEFNPTRAIQTDVTEFGTKYNQVIPIEGVNGRIIDVNFAWIKNNDEVVRLVTGVPIK